MCEVLEMHKPFGVFLASSSVRMKALPYLVDSQPNKTPKEIVDLVCVAACVCCV